jgi:hypothetical protein
VLDDLAKGAERLDWPVRRNVADRLRPPAAVANSAVVVDY